MVFVEAFSVLVPRTELGFEEGIGHCHRGAFSDVERAHRKEVRVIRRSCSLCGWDSFANGGVHVRNFRSGDVDSHSGPAEGEGPFELAFCDLRTKGETDAVVHGGARDVRGEVGDGPTSLLQVCLHRLYSDRKSVV